MKRWYLFYRSDSGRENTFIFVNSFWVPLTLQSTDRSSVIFSAYKDRQYLKQFVQFILNSAGNRFLMRLLSTALWIDFAIENIKNDIFREIDSEELGLHNFARFRAGF